MSNYRIKEIAYGWEVQVARYTASLSSGARPQKRWDMVTVKPTAKEAEDHIKLLRKARSNSS